MTIEMRIEGMSCGHCVRAVHDALSAVDGVEKVDVDLESGMARVDAAEGVSSEQLAAAVREEGYEVIGV